VGRIYFAQGTQEGSFIPVFERDGQDHHLFRFATNGNLRVWFRYLRRKKPFDSEALRQELRERLNQIPGVSVPADSLNGMPRISLSALESDSGITAFTQVLEWVIERIKTS
jgi:hypothetical protein